MAIRLSGMNSGLDTDSIVKALVSGYTTKKENMKSTDKAWLEAGILEVTEYQGVQYVQ